MWLKLLIFLIMTFVFTSYADDSCTALYNRMKKTIKKQKTKTCRVTGVDEERTDLIGFFFNFEHQGVPYPAVFIYGYDYDEMLYSGADYYVTHAKCVENDKFRIIYTVMTPDQILSKLFSYKHCEEGFNHPPSEGPHTTSPEHDIRI